MENTNLARKQQKIFAGNTTVSEEQIAVFGSKANTGTMEFSKDPDIIQNEYYGKGWQKATLLEEAPLQEDFNAIDFVESYNLAYLFQKGIPEYSENTTYFKGSICLLIDNDGKPTLYYSKTNSNTGNNPATDTTNWEKLQLGGGSGNNLFDFKFADHQLNDQSWLRSDTFSWQDGSVYSNAYNHLLADIQDKTPTSETVESITINYILADDGHKIILASDATSLTNLETLYANTGIAWYYILDTENTKFKLPRSQWGFVGLRSGGNVGEYVEATLPNITGKFNGVSRYQGDQFEGSFYKAGESVKGNSDPGNSSIVGFDASRSNSIYKNNATVQQKASQMYLYFYVGDFEVDKTIEEISSLLDTKADIDLGNITSEAKDNISSFTGLRKINEFEIQNGDVEVVITGIGEDKIIIEVENILANAPAELYCLLGNSNSYYTSNYFISILTLDNNNTTNWIEHSTNIKNNTFCTLSNQKYVEWDYYNTYSGIMHLEISKNYGNSIYITGYAKLITTSGDYIETFNFNNALVGNNLDVDRIKINLNSGPRVIVSFQSGRVKIYKLL